MPRPYQPHLGFGIACALHLNLGALSMKISATLSVLGLLVVRGSLPGHHLPSRCQCWSLVVGLYLLLLPHPSFLPESLPLCPETLPDSWWRQTVLTKELGNDLVILRKGEIACFRGPLCALGLCLIRAVLFLLACDHDWLWIEDFYLHMCVLLCFMYVVSCVRNTHFWNSVTNRNMGKNGFIGKYCLGDPM